MDLANVLGLGAGFLSSSGQEREKQTHFYQWYEWVTKTTVR
jgi:hypothetical protein